MLNRNRTRHGLGAIAAAGMLTIALPAVPAFAQKTKTKPPTIESTASEREVTVDIPNIDAVRSNVDVSTLRQIFSGNLIDHADALANLNADSIAIPTITIRTQNTVKGQPSTATVTLSGLELKDVKSGVAGSASVSGMSVEAPDDATAHFGSLSASQLSLGGMLGFYGLVPGHDSSTFDTIYTGFTFAGGTIASDEVDCTIGSMSTGELKVRPLGTSFAEIMSLMQQLEAEDAEPSPELLGQAVRFYAQVLTSFESSPVEFDGMSCAGIDDDGQNVAITLAGMTMGAMTPGHYPAVSVEGLSIEVDEDSSVSIDNMTFKSMDYTNLIATLESAPAALSEEWFADNARRMMPDFEGFSLANVAVDIPNPDEEDTRLVGGLGSFDLTLTDYRNGIPGNVSSVARNLVLELPEDTEDPQLRQLYDLGLTSLDLGYTFKANWDATDNTIKLTDLSIMGADLANITLVGTLANATEALFSHSESQALAAAMGVAIANLKLDVVDAGLSDLLLAVAATEQNAKPEQLRPIMAGLAEGTIIGIMTGAAEAQKVGAAIGSFVSGRTKHLTVDLTANQSPGLGFLDFMAAEEDPAALIGKVTIDASAQ